MKPHLPHGWFRLLLPAICFQLLSTGVFAQIESFSTGSFIINMGATNPNTVANGLKPYGMIYDLIKNYNVPVKIVIAAGKVKDGVDFSYNGVSYRGGTMLIQAEYRNAAVNARIAYWTGQGVVGTTTTSPLSLPVTKTLVSIPSWTLDAQNGKIAEGFLLNAGINNISFPGAYNWKAPATLDCCDDYFVMPHADPTWAKHGRLWSWNKDCFGAIWAGCHAVSVLENMFNPSNPAQKTNFLSTTGLILFSAHSRGSIPYTHQYPADPAAQYLGKTDLAMQNGSEQIFLPKAGGAWNPSAKILCFDPSQSNVPSISPGAAVAIIYGRGLNDPARGYVMYEAAHNINNGTAGSVAAQRAFFNFSFFNTLYKVPQLSVTGIVNGQQVQGGSTITGLNVVASSILPGMTFTYQWTSGCGGSFSNATGASTNFTAPVVAGASNCVITCKVTDNCGRATFSTFIVILGGASAPTANNDAASMDPACGSGTVTTNVLANDTDPDGGPLSLTQVNGNAGSFITANGGSVSFTVSGDVTYVSAPGFFGVETLNYTVCDNTSPAPLCSTGTYTITVGNPANMPNAFNDAVTIAEDNITNINVLANDVPVVGGPLTVSAITVMPASGKVSINTDNTITYVPNPDFAGTDNFTYRIVNAVGYTKIATVTVNVTDDACNGGTYQVPMPVTVTNTVRFSPTNDTYLDQNSPLKNYGITTTILADGQSTQVHRPLLKFDLSSLPAGVTITNASLQLVATAVASGTGENIEVHPMTRDWSEGINNNNTGAPNWTQYSAGNNWTTAGGDFNASAESTTSVGATGSYTWSVTNMVSSWYSTPANNFGMLLKFTAENTGNQDKTFASKENATISNRPVLSVTYTVTASSGALVLDATEDSYSYEGSKNTIKNPDDNWVGNSAGGSDRNFSMLKFPVNGTTLPAGANLTSASLSMEVRSTLLPPAGITVNAYEITQNWLETQMTWNNRLSGTAWTTPGGTFNAAIQGSASLIPSSTSSTWALTNLVQGWMNTPANNFGVLLKDPTNQTAAAYYVRYYDKDLNANPVLRPRLTLNWTSYTCPAIPPRMPLGMPDTATTLSVAPVVFNVVNNDQLFGQALSALSISTPPAIAQGTATANGGGTVTFTPNPTFNGVASFEYTVTTANGSDVVKVYVRVNNSPVVANDDNPAGQNSGVVQTINVLANDNDPEGAPLTVTLLSQPANGVAVLNGSNQVVYTPNPGFTGTDSLRYQVCEPSPATCGIAYCDTAVVTITVNNRVPVPNPDSKTGLPCQAMVLNLLINDTDPEGNALTVTNISALSNPAAGTLVNNNDGTVTFTPALGFLGVVSFTYTVTDNGNPPQTSGPTTVTLTIAAAPNNAPVAVNDIADPSNMDEALYYDVTANDYDPDDNALTNPVITANPLHGTAVVLANGLIRYIPNPGFFGTDVLTYQVCDIVLNPATCTPGPGLCATATLTINVIAPNTVYAVNDQNSTWINVPVGGGVMINDFDLENNAIIFTGFLDNTGVARMSGSITVSGTNFAGGAVANAGTLNINAGGNYTFFPATDFTGVITVAYTIRDNFGNSALDTGSLKITVNPLNAVANSTIANNDEYITYGAAISNNLLLNDRDPQADAMTVSSYYYDGDGDGITESNGTTGSPVTIGGKTLSGMPVSNAGVFVLQANGDYNFTPAADFHGQVDIVYSICDNGLPTACSFSSLHIDILPDINAGLNDRPFNGDDFMYTTMNMPVTSNYTGNDYDPNGDVMSVNGTGINVAGPHNPVQTIPTLAGGSITLYSDGTCTYTPPLNYTGPDQAGYTICDPGALCSNATLYMLVGNNPLLPIDLLTFTGKRSGKDNLLQWSTAQENKSHHFEIEHRTDNSAFAKIGQVAARGNSSVQSNYNFVHRDPPAGVNYYRLKLVDVDGSLSYSKTVAINNEGVGITINSVYPNPFSDKVDIAITLLRAEKFTINLYDVSGKLVRTSVVMGNGGLNMIMMDGLRNLASGTYYIEIRTNEDIIRTKLFKTY